jgi:hypothetical protein
MNFYTEGKCEDEGTDEPYTFKDSGNNISKCNFNKMF